jgi:hypothetical protein
LDKILKNREKGKKRIERRMVRKNGQEETLRAMLLKLYMYKNHMSMLLK